MSRRDDQRMRELANRLVAMAPEPPPFPEEEVTLTTPSKSSRPRPLLVFAGAALLVLIGAAIPLLLIDPGSESPPVGTTTPPVTEAPPVDTTEPAQTTEPTTATTEPTETTEQAPSMATFETAVFLVQNPENSLSGNPALVPFWTEVEGPAGSTVEFARLQLLTNEALTPPAPEFYNAVPDDVEILGVSREGETLLVEVNEAFRAGAGGLLSDMTMLNQLVYTATYLNDADVVQFLIEGQPIVDFGTDGLDISAGLTRETLLDSMSLVLVTHPVYIGDGLPQVEGIANVFEATVSLEIIDADGDVAYEAFTTATCGTGCWGEYVFALDTPALTADSRIRVFWNSPNDGSRMDVVYIPFADDAVWELVPEE